MAESKGSAPDPRRSSSLVRTLLRRPTLLILVYGLCLVLVGITASAQAGVITLQYQQTALESVVANDASLVRAVVNSEVRLTDLPPAGPTVARQAELAGVLAALAQRSGIERIELRAVDGLLIASDNRLGAGTELPPSAQFTSAQAGRASASLVSPSVPGPDGAPITGDPLIREDLPLVAGDAGVRAVMTVWRDASPILATIDEMRRQVVVLTVTAAVILAVILTFVFHSAQVRIHRQTAALVDSSQRDPITGLLNHGAIVDILSASLLDARLEAGSVSVALVDIDNFRLVNDTLGHEAGDEALVLVARRLEEIVPPGAVLGRYGPDEFLLFASGYPAELLPAIESARAAVSTLVLRKVDGDAIPVTISAGLAASPGDAAGVTELLALAAQTLASAKASGGDVVRTRELEADAADSRAFDVFEGLVIAIDTKDRYTKRHSEDVARYGLFIADLLKLDAELQRAIRIAGLLHDVGKIGIPDKVLRKPGRLSVEESSIVQQHVALGDMIVRDLPDIDVVRAGIRHHHERWDGKGYLHGLAGDEIPLIARILAVGDAFSAMTTTRPYRKALPVREALIRLADGAGTQLDETIVAAFVTGMERSPTAPLPGSPAAALWTPSVVASPGVAA
jgi:diguanylate cyclase (GGDEF)-like protein